MSLLTHPGAASAALALSHMPMVVRGLAPLRLTDAAQPITIDFALKPRNAGQIPALLQAISDPKSQMYGHYLTQAEYRAKFAPTQAQVDQAVAYAKPQGLTVGHVSPSRMLVHATGTAAQMNAAFGVTLHDYVSLDPRDNGRLFHSPTSEPALDASIAPLLTGVVGLSNAAVPHSDSSDPSAVSVPSSVTVSSGTSSRTFNLSVSKTAPNETVTITASYNGQAQTAQIAVSPAPITLKSVVASPASTEGGTSTTSNRVYLTGNATATTVVSLTSSNPTVLSVPKTITVQQGYSSHVFTVTTQPVTSEQDVTITATSGGMTQTTVVTVTP